MQIVWLLLAESATEIGLSAGGWASAGLLGTVLGVIFLRLLPEKDRQVKELIEGKDAMASAKDAQFVDNLQKTSERERLMMAEFKDALKLVVEGFDRRSAEQVLLCREQQKELSERMEGVERAIRELEIQPRGGVK